MTEPHPNSLWIGLTGGIGSGKSTVTKLLAAYGATIADADLIAREIVANPETLAEIKSTFGDTVINIDSSGTETLNRAALAQIVFNDSDKLTQLNQITHPKITETALGILKTVATGKIGVYDAAILLDHGRPRHLDLIIVVTAPTSERIQRLVTYRGMNAADAKARIANQITDQQRAQYADYLIENDTNLEDLTTKVQQLWHVIQQHPKLHGHYQTEPSVD